VALLLLFAEIYLFASTTYSCVGFVPRVCRHFHRLILLARRVNKGGRIEIIPNDQGRRITPSWVSFPESGERLVGDSAKHAFHSNPSNTVFDAKRLIGHNYEDWEVQQDIKHWPFNVATKAGKPVIRVNHGHKLRDFVSFQCISGHSSPTRASSDAGRNQRYGTIEPERNCGGIFRRGSDSCGRDRACLSVIFL
jgi:hypothetical protein